VAKFLKMMSKTAKISKDKAKNSLNDMSYSEAAITSNINRACRELKIEFPLTRNNLINICKKMNLHLSYIQATEAIVYCRGLDLESSK
jgi:hypothetical protein